MGATVPSTVAPRIAALVRLLGSDADAEALGAARELRRTLLYAGSSLGALAAAIDQPEPIIVPQALSGRSRKREPVSVRVRMAERLMRLDSNPRVDLTTWERSFIASVVPGLRADLPLSERQAANVNRLLRKPRRRLR